MKSVKYFTIEEADSFIPRINKILRQLSTFKTRLEEENVMLSAEEFEQLFENPHSFLPSATSEELTDNGELLLVLKEFVSHIKELEDIGCILRDLDQGIVDFPSRFQGKDVFLCWKLNEERIKNWHRWNEEYEARKKILELGVKHGRHV